MSFLINVDICVEKDGLNYHAFCPLFKGLHTESDTNKEALNNAKKAITAYVLSLLKNHDPIPCCRILRDEVKEASNKIKFFNENVEIPEVVA